MITGAAAAGHQHFDASKFDAEIEKHGAPVLLRKSSMCPCRDERTSHADVACTFCDSGLIWDAGTLTKVFAFNRKKNEVYEAAGQRLEGSTQFSFLSTVVPGHLDMLVLQSGEMVVNNEFHVRGDTDNAGRSTERLRVRPAIEIETVHSIDSASSALVEYSDPEDLSVNDAGDIEWVPGRGPAVGDSYTMRYRARPTYIAWGPYSRDENGVTMPYRSLALRYDFFDPKSVGEA